MAFGTGSGGDPLVSGGATDGHPGFDLDSPEPASCPALPAMAEAKPVVHR